MGNKLSNKENDALDEAWEVMLVDAESQQKVEGTSSSDNSTQMESRAQPPRSRSRSTSRSKMRELKIHPFLYFNFIHEFIEFIVPVRPDFLIV